MGPRRGCVATLRVQGRVCSTCRWWRPHFHYPSIGLCARHHKLTLEGDTCPEWEQLKVGSGGFYWCETCRARLSWEEAVEHHRRGHRVYEAPYVEPDVKEEIMGARE